MDLLVIIILFWWFLAPPKFLYKISELLNDMLTLHPDEFEKKYLNKKK